MIKLNVPDKGIAYELEYGKDKKTYIIVRFDCEDLEKYDIWMDTHYIPKLHFVLALNDAIPIITGLECGKEENIRDFLPLEYLLNEMTGPKEWTDLYQDIKDKIIKKLPEIREELREHKEKQSD